MTEKFGITLKMLIANRVKWGRKWFRFIVRLRIKGPTKYIRE